MTFMKKIRGLLVAVAVTGAAIMGMAASANAADRDGVCDPVNTYGYGFGEACFYYLANRQGSLADFSAENPSNPDLYVTDPTLADDFFISAGAGQGVSVDNNARSICNTDWYPLYLFQGYNFTGFTIRLPGVTSATASPSCVNIPPFLPFLRFSSYYWWFD